MDNRHADNRPESLNQDNLRHHLPRTKPLRGGLLMQVGVDLQVNHSIARRGARSERPREEGTMTGFPFQIRWSRHGNGAAWKRRDPGQAWRLLMEDAATRGGRRTRVHKQFFDHSNRGAAVSYP